MELDNLLLACVVELDMYALFCSLLGAKITEVCQFNVFIAMLPLPKLLLLLVGVWPLNYHLSFIVCALLLISLLPMVGFLPASVEEKKLS